jgi:hypothetical protein
MRKFRSELYEAIYEDFLDDFESGFISEAEFKEFEADAFIEEEETLPEEKSVTKEQVTA